MGIQGFTKFINDRAQEYFENFELRDCKLVIDGHSLSCQLYNWKHWQFDARSNSCYGGDYDKYAYIVENFFLMLKDVNVRPLVVFDGGFEQRKLPTILRRMQDKICIADKLDPTFEANQPNCVVFPLLLREAFKDVLRKLDVKMLMCEYEGDTEIASIARSSDCPVLTFDSDYFLFGAKYIPFRTLNCKVTSVQSWRTGSYKCISCKIYKVEKLLATFPGLQLNTLHLLPVLLGNDYIDCHVFQTFLSSIGISDTTSSQDKIQRVLEWLKSCDPKKAIESILTSFKTTKERHFILNRIEKIVTSYYFVESKLFRYLNIKKHGMKQNQRIDFEIIRNEVEHLQCNTETQNDKEESESKRGQNHKDISMCTNSKSSEKKTEVDLRSTKTSKNMTREPLNTAVKELNANNQSATKVINPTHTIVVTTTEEKTASNETILESVKITTETFEAQRNKDESCSFDFKETHLEKDNTSKNSVSKQFMDNFTNVLYPSSFMDILTQNIFYLIPQVENYSEENSHKVSFDVLCAIHKILTNSQGADFTIVGRGEGTKVLRFPQEQPYSVKVPSLEEIEQLALQERRELLFKLLNIETGFVSSLEKFPTEWHSFLVAFKFLATKVPFDATLIYSIILCFIILNYVDQRVDGYCRSVSSYKRKFYSYLKNLPPVNDHVPFKADKNCFCHFPKKDCILFLGKVVRHFSIDPSENSSTFDKNLIHQMAHVQSVLLHVKYLNSLLKFPYPDLIISKIFDSTFIYNLTKSFKKKSAELEVSYLDVFFNDCPTILAGLRYVLKSLIGHIKSS